MGIQVIDRAIRIVDTIAASGHATLTSLSIKAGLPVSTVSRIVDSLIANGLVAYDPAARAYRLGTRLLFLSSRVQHQRLLSEAAHPVLEWLAARSEEDTGLSVLRGTHAVIVDRVDGPHPLKIIDVLGRPVPLYAGAFRRVLLAYQHPDWIQRYLRSTRLSRFTKNTMITKTALAGSLKSIRELGYGVSFGEHLAGSIGIAAPVLGASSDIEASLFIVGPNSRVQPNIDRIAHLVVQGAHEVSRRSRGEPPIALPPKSRDRAAHYRSRWLSDANRITRKEA